MSLRTLATLSLIALTTLASACGSSERRGTATSYDGPSQAENEEPGGSTGSGGFADTLAQLLSAQIANETRFAALFCECTFENQGYNSAEQCIADQGSDTGSDALVAACIRGVVAEQPAPSAAFQGFASEALAASHDYDTCIDQIDASECTENFDPIDDAIDDCEDARDEVLDSYEPSAEDEAWIAQLQIATEDAGCFDFGFGGGETLPPDDGGLTPDPEPGDGF